MSENATQPTDIDVEQFLNDVEHPRRREQAFSLLPLFEEWTGIKPVIWANGLAGKTGSGIIGFGRYHYKYKSGREGEWFLTGFSPRAKNITIYIMPGFEGKQDTLVELGPHTHSVSCLYLTNLLKNDLGALEKLVRDSVDMMKDRYEWTDS